MTKMTKAQVDYAIRRLTETYRTRQAAIRAEHETPEKKLSMDQKWQMVLAGRAAARADLTYMTGSSGWMGLFDWSEHEHDAVMSPAGEQQMELLKRELTRAKDEIMLGDAEEALALLRAFASREGGE